MGGPRWRHAVESTGELTLFGRFGVRDDRGPAFAAGMNARREIFGASGAEGRLVRATDFGRPFEEFVTRYCSGKTWTPPGPDRKTRILITLATLMASTKPNQLKVHELGALANGCTVDESGETILHAVAYAGLPCGVEAFNAAAEALARHSAAGSAQ